ncbi:MAG: SDR family oxidoreductase [bacterium]
MTKAIAIVTGGSSGLGLEIARLLLQKDLHVCIVGRSSKKLATARQTLAHHAGRGTLISFQGNAAHEEDVASMFSMLTEQGYQVTHVVNCAGQGFFGEPDQTDQYIINEVFDSNLISLMLVSTYALRVMKEQGGVILNVMSTSALVGRGKETVYCAAKWGARGYTESLKLALQGSNISVISVFPGGMKTPFWENHPERANDVAAFMDPAEVAERIIDAAFNIKTGIISDLVIQRKR